MNLNMSMDLIAYFLQYIFTVYIITYAFIWIRWSRYACISLFLLVSLEILLLNASMIKDIK